MINLPKSLTKKSNVKEVKKMSRFLSIVIAITMIVSTNGLAFAAFDSQGTEIFTATSGTIGSPADPVTVVFSASLKNVSDDTSASQIDWSNVIAGTTGWLASNQYIAVKGWSVYSGGWGIQIYTNNTNYTGTGEPAGLVNTSNPIYSLPMCWRTKVGYYDSDTGNPTDTGSEAISSQELQINQGTSLSSGDTVLYDGVSGHEPGGTSEYFPWSFILDKTDPDVDANTTGDQAFGNYQDLATYIGSAGYQHAPTDYATPSDPNDTYYVYLGAKFTLASGGATYTTDSLTVEMYHL